MRLFESSVSWLVGFLLMGGPGGTSFDAIF